MNGPVSFHRLARFELTAAARYYEAQSPGLGLRFLDAIEQCVRAIIEFPDSGKTLRGEVKRRLVNGFPYGLLYRRLPDELRVLAIMNLKRRPMYWVGRQ